MKNFKKLIKEAYLGNPLNEEETSKGAKKYFGVFRIGGSMGQGNEKLVYSFAKKEDAINRAKELRSRLTPGEKSHYGMRYVTRPTNVKPEPVNEETLKGAIEKEMKDNKGKFKTSFPTRDLRQILNTENPEDLPSSVKKVLDRLKKKYKINEGIEGTPQYYVKYTTQDGETAKSGFMSKREAIKKEEALVNSGVKKSAVYRIQKHVDLNGKPYTIDTELDKEIDYRKDEKGRPINEIESGDVVVYNHDDHTVQGIKNFDGDTMVSIRPKTKHWTGAPQDAFWVKPTDIETKEEFLDRMMRDQIQHDEETLRRERGLEEESNDEKMERDQAIQSYKRLTDDDELKLKQIKAMLDKERGLEETAGTFGDGVTKKTKELYAEKTKELYDDGEVKSDDFSQLGIEDKQKVIAAVTGPKLKDILSKSSSRVDEIDMNDPVLIKTRASQMKRDKIEADEKDKKSYLDTKYGPTFMDKLAAEIDLKNELKNLEKEREDVLMRIEDIGFETEETAEPEGGEKADDLADRLTAAEKELRAIDNKITDVKDELGHFRMYESVNETGTGIPKPKFLNESI